MSSESEGSGALFERIVRPEEVCGIKVLEHAAIESVWGILERCPVLVLKPGDALLDKGQRRDTLYLVVDGALCMHTAERVEDQEEAMTVVRAGGCIGQMSLLDGSPSPGRVVAAEPTRLIEVDDQAFWRLATASHAFALNCLVSLSGDLRSRDAVLARSVDLPQPLQEETTTDGLTGLHNRKWLMSTMPRLAVRHARDRKPFSIMLLDIDRFRQLNDTYGQAAGDRVLTALGRLLRWCLRPTDLAARCGGDEFCVMLPATMREGARAAGSRLRETIASTDITTDEGTSLPHVTVSVGVAQLGDGDDDVKLLAAAREAAARANRNGGGRVEW